MDFLKILEMNDEEVGPYMRQERIKTKILQEEFADILGWSQSKVSRHETGQIPFTLPELKAYANALTVKREGKFFIEWPKNNGKLVEV